MKQKAEEIRFKDNPFVKDLVVSKKTKQVKVSALGKDENVLVNTITGEQHGTHVVTYKQVDDAEFVKLFTANIAMTFELNKAGYKSLGVLVYAVQQREAIGRDLIELNKYMYEDFQKKHNVKGFGMVVFNRGLKELEEAQIIAKSLQRGKYFINPNFIFNGDRIAFTKVIERKRRETDEHQQELDI